MSNKFEPFINTVLKQHTKNDYPFENQMHLKQNKSLN